MLIANPTYDTVFKYFLEDNKLAKHFIGILLEVTILELEFQPQEIALQLSSIQEEEKRISIVRLDFKARIVDDKGNSRIVLIELQKTKNIADMFRFRNYLGAQYQNPDNSILEKEIKIPIPIVSVYFLGFSLDVHKNVPIIKVKRKYTDLSTKEELEGEDPFIEVLTHNTLIVQLPALRERKRFEIEKILSIFDLRPEKFIEIDENKYPLECREFLTRLHNAMENPNVIRDLFYEEQLNLELRRNFNEVKELRSEVKRLKEVEEQKRKAIQNLKQKGLSITEIASVFNISAEEIENMTLDKNE